MIDSTDWKKIAEAQGLKLEAADLGVAVARLEALEARLRALAPSLSPDDTPAVDLRLEGGRK